MYRLAVISIESGMCIANPVYREKETCVRVLEEIFETGAGEMHICPEDVTGRFYYINGEGVYNFVIESVHEEEMQ